MGTQRAVWEGGGGRRKRRDAAQTPACTGAEITCDGKGKEMKGSDKLSVRVSVILDEQ